MAQEKQQPKFERNPCIRFRDNCDTDGRTTDDGQKSHTMTSADSQGELKNAHKWSLTQSTLAICGGNTQQ